METRIHRALQVVENSSNLNEYLESVDIVNREIWNIRKEAFFSRGIVAKTLYTQATDIKYELKLALDRRCQKTKFGFASC